MVTTTNNLQNIFDSITGYGGAAATDNWESMSRSELIDQINGQADNFYESISDADAERIADAVQAYKQVTNSNDGWHLRESLA